MPHERGRIRAATSAYQHKHSCVFLLLPLLLLLLPQGHHLYIPKPLLVCLSPGQVCMADKRSPTLAAPLHPILIAHVVKRYCCANACMLVVAADATFTVKSGNIAWLLT
jgi:hypothetical protein